MNELLFLINKFRGKTFSKLYYLIICVISNTRLEDKNISHFGIFLEFFKKNIENILKISQCHDSGNVS